MDLMASTFAYFTEPMFVLLTFFGAVAGLFIGSIPGLSVSMATALLVSVTYTWQTDLALGTIMGVYVVGVFSGAISAILINIPGAPSSVVTTLDGYPLAQKGEASRALKFATFYSFTGSIFGFIVLSILAEPISSIALQFQPMDYFLLALFGLTTVGSLSSKSFSKGLFSAIVGLAFSMVGMDPVVGTPRLTFGIDELNAGINVIPALVGLFGISEVFCFISDVGHSVEINKLVRNVVKIKDISKHFIISLYYSAIGALVGALPGAGGPVASFIAYGEAKRIVKNPSVPFGEGAIEGIVASESSNNACIGGALIPMLTLAVPGDAVTAIILSVFYIHGLQPGPMFLKNSPDMFSAILAGGFLSCIFLLFLGLIIAPRISKIISIPKKYLVPIISVLCIVGAFSCNNRLFDVLLMILFGVLGLFMKSNNYPVAPLTLGLVLGSMMDSNFRRAISLASTELNFLTALFVRPITIILLTLTVLTVLSNFVSFKKVFARMFKR